MTPPLTGRLQFVSYPKSGRTWVRYILLRLEHAQAIAFHHDGFEFNDGSFPAHDFDVERRLATWTAEERIVYLERDPRDVMVSLFHQITGRFSDIFGYRGTISEFIRDPYFGATNLLRFRRMWREIVRRRDVHVMTYEAMHLDAVGEIEKLLIHYGLPFEPNRLCAAVRNASFGEMKMIEESEAVAEPWLRPRNGFSKVRKGRVHGYEDELTAEDIVFLNSLFSGEAPISVR